MDTIMVDRNGIEPFLQACKARVPPTTPTAHNFQHTVANVCIEALYMDEPTCHTARKCFDTPDFYHLRYRHKLRILRDALICNFKVLPARVAIALNKNPRVFSPGVLLDSECSFRLHFVSNRTLTSWNTIRWCKTA